MNIGSFLYLAYLGLGIYFIVLVIKLMTRGIKALDIYISKEDHL